MTEGARTEIQEQRINAKASPQRYNLCSILNGSLVVRPFAAILVTKAAVTDSGAGLLENSFLPIYVLQVHTKIAVLYYGIVCQRG